MDDNPPIDGDDPEILIPRAVKGSQDDLRCLLADPWFLELLDNVSGKTARDYHVDSVELWFLLVMMVSEKLGSLENPGGLAWRQALAGWLKRSAINHALNMLRHRGVEESFCDRVAHEQTRAIRNGRRMAELTSPSVSQEEEVEQAKRAALQSKLRRAAREVYNSLAREDAELISMWSDGKKLREIRDVTGLSISTVSDRQKVILKTFVRELTKVAVKEVGATKAEEARVKLLLKNLKECGKGLRLLIRNALRDAAHAT